MELTDNQGSSRMTNAKRHLLCDAVAECATNSAASSIFLVSVLALLLTQAFGRLLLPSKACQFSLSFTGICHTLDLIAQHGTACHGLLLHSTPLLEKRGNA